MYFLEMHSKMIIIFVYVCIYMFWQFGQSDVYAWFQFLDALELSQSPLLLKLMTKVLCRDKKHIMEDLFQTCFQKIARQ